jgi:hypothetical protein
MRGGSNDRHDKGRDAMQHHGIHHLTTVAADARGNHDFYGFAA